MKHLERISLKKDPKIPLVTVKEHLIRYIFSIDHVLNKDVLDIACGTGYGMQIMSYWAKTVSGYDYSKEAIEEAGRLVFPCPVCLEVRDLNKTMTYANDKAKIFDIITCFETLEHLEDPEFILTNINTALKPGGTFLLSVPNQPSGKDINEWHKHAFNVASLSKLLAKYFEEKPIQWFGQNQYGLSNNLNREYLFCIIPKK